MGGCIYESEGGFEEMLEVKSNYRLWTIALATGMPEPNLNGKELALFEDERRRFEL